MAGCDWQDEVGVRRLVVDFRGGDTAERLDVLKTAIGACQTTGSHISILVRWESDGLDMGFLKHVKDANRMLGHLDIRAAFLGLGAKGTAIAALFNIRVGHERVRSFDDEGAALAWLEEAAHGGR